MLTFAISIGFLNVTWVDFIDITLVSILLYQVYKLMKGSVAVKIFIGFLSLYLIYLVVRAAQMELLSNILGQFMGVGVLAMIILFQQEIRKFLLLIGKTTIFDRENLFKSFSFRRNQPVENVNITPIIEASKSLGGSNTGALIVISKSSELKFYAESGDLLDARISKRLLLSIFNKYSPLHDGAVIIHEGKIKAARCILPVTEREDISAQLGLRHRAAIGMSEVTDTLVLVVSEETGQMSIVHDGRLHHNLSAPELRKMINEYLFEERASKKSRKAKEEGTEEDGTVKSNEEKELNTTSS
ncbi:diadenylate cyclase CdaA [Roseivirga sp. BDSF3-8]|uniref:diadenylate cyclase CdaA n=1 Tax=Roseivirga sp. BDSF3-8 TaxID=3241598 RepID=UPI003532579C